MKYFYQFHKNDLNKLFSGYARTERVFNKYYEKMRRHGQIYTDWIEGIGDKSLWALAFDGGYRCGHMTTNLVECINGTLKGVRHLPITAMVKATYYRMVNLFVTKSDEVVAQKTGGNGFSVFLETQMQHNVATAGRFQVITFDGFHNTFEVKDKRSDTRYAVNM